MNLTHRFFFLSHFLSCFLHFSQPLLPHNIALPIALHHKIIYSSVCMSLCVALVDPICHESGQIKQAEWAERKEPSTRPNRISNDRSRVRGTCSLSAPRCVGDVEDHAWRSVDSPLGRLITLKCGLCDAGIPQDHGELHVDDPDTGSQLTVPSPKCDGCCGVLSQGC